MIKLFLKNRTLFFILLLTVIFFSCAQFSDSENRLSVVKVSGGELIPEFNPDITEYQLMTIADQPLELEVKKLSKKSSCCWGNGSQSRSLDNPESLSVEVTSAEGDSLFYNFVLSRALEELPVLSEIVLDGKNAQLVPAFDPNITEYTALVDFFNPQLNVDALIGSANSEKYWIETEQKGVEEQLFKKPFSIAELAEGFIFEIKVSAKDEELSSISFIGDFEIVVHYRKIYSNFYTITIGEQQPEAIYVSYDFFGQQSDGSDLFPFQDIQSGINEAVKLSIDEVRVATGDYYQTKTLIIPSGVTLVGGYNYAVKNGETIWNAPVIEEEGEPLVNLSAIHFFCDNPDNYVEKLMINGIAITDICSTVAFHGGDGNQKTGIESFKIMVPEGEISKASAVFLAGCTNVSLNRLTLSETNPINEAFGILTDQSKGISINDSDFTLESYAQCKGVEFVSSQNCSVTQCRFDSLSADICAGIYIGSGEGGHLLRGNSFQKINGMTASKGIVCLIPTTIEKNFLDFRPVDNENSIIPMDLQGSGLEIYQNIIIASNSQMSGGLCIRFSESGDPIIIGNTFYSTHPASELLYMATLQSIVFTNNLIVTTEEFSSTAVSIPGEFTVIKQFNSNYFATPNGMMVRISEVSYADPTNLQNDYLQANGNFNSYSPLVQPVDFLNPLLDIDSTDGAVCATGGVNFSNEAWGKLDFAGQPRPAVGTPWAIGALESKPAKVIVTLQTRGLGKVAAPGLATEFASSSFETWRGVPFQLETSVEPYCYFDLWSHNGNEEDVFITGDIDATAFITVQTPLTITANFTWPEIYVAPMSPGEGTGTKTNPFTDIQFAINEAARIGTNKGTITISSGDYSVDKPIVLRPGINLLGSYNEDFTPTYLGSYTSRSNGTNVLFTPAVLESSSQQPLAALIANNPSVDSNTLVEGLSFTIQNGPSVDYTATALFTNGASPKLVSNIFNSTGAKLASYGILCDSATPQFLANFIVMSVEPNASSSIAFKSLHSAGLQLSSNVFLPGIAMSSMVGMEFIDSPNALIFNNTVVMGSNSFSGIGISLLDSPNAQIINNLLYGPGEFENGAAIVEANSNAIPQSLLNNCFYGFFDNIMYSSLTDGNLKNVVELNNYSSINSNDTNIDLDPLFSDASSLNFQPSVYGVQTGGVNLIENSGYVRSPQDTVIDCVNILRDTNTNASWSIGAFNPGALP